MSNSQTVKVFGENGFSDPTQSDLQKLAESSPSVTKADGTQQGGKKSKGDGAKYIQPPEDPSQLLNLLEKSETHQACVSAKSKAVAGYGFDIVPHDSTAPDSVGDVPDTLTDFWYGGTFQLGPGKIHASATEVNESAWDDLESMGYLTIEMLVNPATGEPTGLSHIPAQKIRKRKDKLGFVELDDAGQIATYYSAAGARYGDEPRFVDAESGDVTKSADGVDTVANELIVLRNYSALAPHYGLPDIIPGIKTVAGDLAAKEYNRIFFENDTVPRFAVVVEGGELTDRAWNELEKQFKKLRQNENAHRGLLLETASTVKTQLGEATGANIRIEPLTVGVDEDAGFVEYRDNNEHYILQAHGVPPVVAGRTEDVNRSSAKAQWVNFAQTTVAPKQERFAARLYEIIHKQAFGIEDWTIEFNLHNGEDELRSSEILKNKASAVKALGKVMTADEVRSEFFNLPPLDEVEGETISQANAPDIEPGQQPPEEGSQDDQSDEND